MAAALIVVVAALGSAAAYTGVLPRPMQHLAHVTVGAPDNKVPRLSSAADRRDTGRGRGTAGHPAAGPTGSARAAQTPGQANASEPYRQLVPPATGACAPGPWRDQGTTEAKPRHPSPPAARCPKPPSGTPYIPAKASYIPAK